jgi:hypothetical protein
MEQCLEAMAAKGRTPDLYIDFHNDKNGRVSFKPPPQWDAETIAHLTRSFEAALRNHTWFTEGCRTSKPSPSGGGLSHRFGFMAIGHELNADYIAGLDQPACAEHWKTYGACLPQAFAEYFDNAIQR